MKNQTNDLKQLLISYDQINKQLVKVQTPEYIAAKVKEIWTEEKSAEIGRKTRDGLKEILKAL